MFGKLMGHMSHHLHKAKQHFKTVSDFGQRAWDTVGHVVKKTTQVVNGANAEASNFRGMHPMIDDGIGFLNRFTGGVNQVFDMCSKADEKKNTIEQSFKEKTAGLDAVSRGSDATNRALNASGQLTRRSAM